MKCQYCRHIMVVTQFKVSATPKYTLLIINEDMMCYIMTMVDVHI